jgi:hypothetical protein
MIDRPKEEVVAGKSTSIPLIVTLPPTTEYPKLMLFQQIFDIRALAMQGVGKEDERDVTARRHSETL